MVWICVGHPQPVPVILSEGIDSWFRYNIINSARDIKHCVVEFKFHVKCVDGYLYWFPTVSLHRIIPPRKREDDLGPSHLRYSHGGSSHANIGVPSNEVSPPSPPPHGTDDS